MQNKYKVQFVRTQKYIVDVLAGGEEEAKSLARLKFDVLVERGMERYHEDADPEVSADTVLDVTNTDDPFNP